MPQRPYHPEQPWLLPVDPAEWLADDHPVRFIPVFIGALRADDWGQLGITPAAAVGAPRFAPELLLQVWTAGFMLGIRSVRDLERACRDLVPMRWLTGGQVPDHSTLWRFYDGHRAGMQGLLTRTVTTAVQVGLLEWAVQAVDGTKVLADAARERSLSCAQLEALRRQTEAAIAELEATNAGGMDPLPGLPAPLQQPQTLRTQIEAALQVARADDAPQRVNLTDPDAREMHTRQGVRLAYNAQAVVVALDETVAGRRGRFVVATAVTTVGTDSHLLPQMVDRAATMTGQTAAVTVADAGYYSGTALQACAEADQVVVVPPIRSPTRKTGRYAQEGFAYNPDQDTYICPEGQTLTRRGTSRAKRSQGHPIYRPDPTVCRACPALGVCTTNHRHGRMLTVSPQAAVLAAHADWMQQPQAQAVSRQRKGLIEGVFGTIKERLGGRRSTVRGLAKVETEWAMRAMAFNLRTLARWAVEHPGMTGQLGIG